MKDLSKEIKAYALKNAIEFGKCDAGRILPKLFQHGLDKKDIGKIMPQIQEIVKEVNAMKQADREKDFEKLKDYVHEGEKREEGELPELEGAISGKVVTRLAPEPSKYSHIGHALVFLIQYLYAQKYKGRCLLRFDDTNPEKSTKDYYDSIKEDLAWLGIKWDKELIASDDMQTFYDFAEQLIKKKELYVCSCSQEEVKELREKMKSCLCQKKPLKTQEKEWKMMLDKKFKEGERTVRLKGDMTSKNGVMRDPIVFRISYHKHFLKGDKYCVWPMYDFESPIEDALNKVTNVIRSNEFELRGELHDHLLKLLKMKGPTVRPIGRYQITGAETQGRVIREMIEKKEVMGWDDPRLVTVKALRRRGFVPEMFQQMAKTVGLSKSGGHISPTVMESINRTIIDPIVNRYSFVKDARELKIDKMPKVKSVEVHIHPDKKEMRKISIGKLFISDVDAKDYSGKEIRLLHLFNIMLGKKVSFTSEENKDIPKVNWVSDGVKVKVLMPDATWIEGLGEEAIKDLKAGEIVQFERFGFVRFDQKNKKGEYEFWFAHK